MTPELFSDIVASAKVRLMTGEIVGLLVEDITQSELAEIFTLAGRQLGAIPNDASLNPEWLTLGPENNITFIFHPKLAVHRKAD